MKKHTIGDAIRMAGHLLEHNPSVGRGNSFKDGRMCFCLATAVWECSFKLKLNRNNAIEHVRTYLRVPILVDAWEGPNTTRETRLDIAKRLQNYKD
jgi:hypothetical protein